jgi:hypothetical protein
MKCFFFLLKVFSSSKTNFRQFIFEKQRASTCSWWCYGLFSTSWSHYCPPELIPPLPLPDTPPPPIERTLWSGGRGLANRAMALKSTGSAATNAATVLGGSSERGAVQKMGNNIFQSRQIQHLHIELRNES